MYWKTPDDIPSSKKPEFLIGKPVIAIFDNDGTIIWQVVFEDGDEDDRK